MSDSRWDSSVRVRFPKTYEPLLSLAMSYNVQSLSATDSRLLPAKTSLTSPVYRWSQRVIAVPSPGCRTGLRPHVSSSVALVEWG